MSLSVASSRHPSDAARWMTPRAPEAVVMQLSWDLFPLAMQAVYLAAALPSLAKLVEHKRSEQRALADHWLVLAAHAAMLAWAWLYAQAPGMAAATIVSIATTTLSAALIVRYRRHPGGKRGAADSRGLPSRLHTPRPVAPVGTPVA